MKEFTKSEGNMRDRSAHQQVTGAVRDGWAGAGNFSATILSGFLVGFLLDKWLGTDPWFTISLILVAAVGGFYRMKAWYQDQNERGR